MEKLKSGRSGKSKLTVQRFAVAAFGCFAALSVAFSTALSGAPQAASPLPAVSTSPPSRVLLDSYCVTCHNQRTKTAGLALDSLNLADVAAHADVWEEVVRKLHRLLRLGLV